VTGVQTCALPICFKEVHLRRRKVTLHTVQEVHLTVHPREALQPKTTAVTSARNQVTILLIALCGKLITNRSILTETPQADITDPPKVMILRGMTLAQEGIRRKIQMMTERRRSIIRSVRAPRRRLIRPVEAVLTGPKHIWERK